MYYKCRRKTFTAPIFAAGFGSSSQCTQRTEDRYPY
ncbi:hypothetical protein LEMLEM_LOCUS21689 [Lemmus lemmus]